MQQGVPLFQGSVEKNIRYGDPEADSAAVGEAYAAAAVDFACPGLTDRSAQELSGGQGRRVEIARALLRRADVYLFDEITSELDSGTKAKVLSGTASALQGKTVLFVSHDREEVFTADRVLAVEAGRIVQNGTPEALLRTGGLFRDLFGETEGVL